MECKLQLAYTAKEIEVNDAAISYLLLIVRDEFLETIGHCDRAFDAWNILEKMHTEIGVIHMAYLMTEYVNFMETDDMTMQEYIARKQEVCTFASAGGMKYTDKQQAWFLVTGLPPEKYDDFIRNMERENALTTQNIFAKVTLEDKRVNREASRGYDVMAFAMKKQVGRPSWKQTRQENEKGDYQNYHQGGAKLRTPQWERNVICFACNEQGHISRNCPKFKGKEKKPDGQKNQDEAKKKYRSARAVLRKCTKLKGNPYSATEDGTNGFYVDTGSPHHMTSCRQLFTYLEESPEAIGLVSQPDDTTLEVRGRGSICIKLDDRYGGWTLRFADVLYVPDLTDSPLPGRKLTKNGLTLTFVGDECFVKDDDGETVFAAFADKDNDGYLFLVKGRRTDYPELAKGTWTAPAVAATRKAVCSGTWHRGFGHLTKLPDADIIKKDCDEISEPCVQGKMKRRPFPANDHRAAEKMDIIHRDVCGPFRHPGPGGERFFMTFQDDKLRYIEAIPIRRKDETMREFAKVQKKREVLQGRNVKFLQTDGGGEYCGRNFHIYREENGI